jgi:hypothetical protein
MLFNIFHKEKDDNNFHFGFLILGINLNLKVFSRI